MNIKEITELQREYFYTGKTLPVSERVAALTRLEESIIKHTSEIYSALKADLGKSEAEAYMCELGMVFSELRFIRKNLKKWAKPQKRKTPIAQFHSKSFIVSEPYGVVLVMSPWNYPFLLSLSPVIGAIAAGNCCILKPSAYAENTSKLLEKIIKDAFAPEYVSVILGGRAENAELLEQKFDYIFFTGSVSVGKLVMKKASESLTPVTLELGGKSPCIIDKTAKLKLAAKRIVFGKFLNLGQTCVAPDYLLVEECIKDELIGCITEEIKAQFGDNPLENKDYGKIINDKHFKRILSLINTEKTVFGGEYIEAECKISPTVLDGVTADDAVMQEEIFGPILPVLTFKSIDDVVKNLKKAAHPLALYLFTEDKTAEERVLNEVPFGGGCVNDTIIHLASEYIPFGGVGNSGMGKYHGIESFKTFTHEKSILKKYTRIDLPMRYQPYTEKNLASIKHFLK